MRKNVVAGNWKMNTSIVEAIELSKKISSANFADKVEVILIPPFVNLSAVKEQTKNTTVKLGAQNNHEAEKGAYTGEISAHMLKAVGVEYGLVGHSERRQYFSETNPQLSAKLKALLLHSISPIFCCGELLEDRQNGTYFKVIEAQLEVVFSLSSEDFKQVIIAYEPVWAIGTGETASSEQAQEIHSFIRDKIKTHYNQDIANSTSILYGGSCNPKNAKELFSMPDVDGGLIGGASLIAEDFLSIISSFKA